MRPEKTDWADVTSDDDSELTGKIPMLPNLYCDDKQSTSFDPEVNLQDVEYPRRKRNTQRTNNNSTWLNTKTKTEAGEFKKHVWEPPSFKETFTNRAGMDILINKSNSGNPTAESTVNT